ncbi:MAG TPA: hypothetical protein VM598_05015 [Bdellovibrionota bacterium]|nr:hypothetical protein [Bdellovibrionota bacterium]
MKAKWIQASAAGFALALGLTGCASPPEKKVSKEKPAEVKQQSGKAASAPVPFKELPSTSQPAAPPAAQISVPAAPGGGCNCSCGSNPPQASGESTPADPLAGITGPPAPQAEG